MEVKMASFHYYHIPTGAVYTPPCPETYPHIVEEINTACAAFDADPEWEKVDDSNSPFVILRDGTLLHLSAVAPGLPYWHRECSPLGDYYAALAEGPCPTCHASAGEPCRPMGTK